MIKTNKSLKRERGNALFLILIAVALFAALSYAVTQSGRGGGGGTSKETATINAGLLTDFPAAVRTAVTRMILTNSATNSTVDYKYGTIGANYGAATADTFSVFETTTGGAVTYVAPPSAAVVTTATAGFAGPHWRFKAIPSNGQGHYVDGVGTAAADSFAFVGVNNATCRAINAGLGLAAQAPVKEGSAVFTTTAATASGGEASPGGTDASRGTIATTNTIGKGSTGQSFACIANIVTATTDDGSQPYIYYHALIEN